MAEIQKVRYFVILVFHSKNMDFTIHGVLEVFQGYTILDYSKFVQFLINYEIIQNI